PRGDDRGDGPADARRAGSSDRRIAGTVRLGVNVDHVAPLRQVRGVGSPDPVEAALVAEAAGADGITVHLREDRRHIQERDVEELRRRLRIKLNLEMAVTDAMVDFALGVRPDDACFVPERREELTTEGGLDVVAHAARVTAAARRLAAARIRVSLFIDPEPAAITASRQAGAHAVELHTGDYAGAAGDAARARRLARLGAAGAQAGGRGSRAARAPAGPAGPGGRGVGAGQQRRRRLRRRAPPPAGARAGRGLARGASRGGAGRRGAHAGRMAARAGRGAGARRARRR